MNCMLGVCCAVYLSAVCIKIMRLNGRKDSVWKCEADTCVIKRLGVNINKSDVT